jgi:hypothetical protein
MNDVAIWERGKRDKPFSGRQMLQKSMYSMSGISGKTPSANVVSDRHCNGFSSLRRVGFRHCPAPSLLWIPYLSMPRCFPRGNPATSFVQGAATMDYVHIMDSTGAS